MIQKPEDYHKYNRICGVSRITAVSRMSITNRDQSLRQLAHRLSLLPPDNPVRRKHEELLLNKLYEVGVLSTSEKLSSVCSASAASLVQWPLMRSRLKRM